MSRSGTAPVREGDLLAGKYRVERVLGAGGMGIVVAARHEQLDQMVAIKFVRDDALDNDEAVARFLREARAAVKLKSEHVARVLDVGKLDSGAPYMVMEYLEGSDLAKVLADRGPMAVDAAADWILQACEAVAEAHAAGIVHRDLKPENLFLTSTVGGVQKVKVLDFGVSKAMGGASGEMSSLTRTRAMLGSPLYMAPEQMRSSRDVDPRADIWALGVVLFQLLTDRWPFEADTMPELCLKVVTEAPLSLASLRPDVPPALVAVIERCIEKDASKRFANAAELATALEPFAQHGSRILAERARLAMAVRSPGHAAPRTLSPGATLPTASPSPGSHPGIPGTSAAWGAERASGAPAHEASGSRTGAVAWVAGVAGVAGIVAGIVAVIFALRSAGPAAPAVGAPPASSASSLPPPARLAESSELPSPALGVAAATPTAFSASAAAAPDGGSAGPVTAVTTSARVPPGKLSPALAAPAHGKSGPSGQDDDIPTIR